MDEPRPLQGVVTRHRLTVELVCQPGDQECGCRPSECRGHQAVEGRVHRHVQKLFFAEPQAGGQPGGHTVDPARIDHARHEGDHPDTLLAHFHRQRLAEAGQAFLGSNVGG